MSDLGRALIVLVVLCIFFAAVPPVAPSEEGEAPLSPAQQEVWNTIERSWEAVRREDPEWADTFLHPDFQEWSTKAPHLFDFDQVKNGIVKDWEAIDHVSTGLEPLSIIVHGCAAVVHYCAEMTFRHADDETGSRRTCNTEVLVQEDEGWRVIASHVTDVE